MTFSPVTFYIKVTPKKSHFVKITFNPVTIYIKSTPKKANFVNHIQSCDLLYKVNQKNGTFVKITFL